MANKAISELPQALNVNNQDLFVLEQSGIAKKLTAETFITEQGIIDALAEALDGHGGIQSVTLASISGRIRTYRITFSDGSATTFQVYDGTSIERISRTSSSGLQDTYTIFMSDGTTTFFTVTNGADGTVSEAMLNDALKDKAPAVTETTESSAIATFSDGADDLVMHNVVVEINPVQSGSGDPSPSNIRPISGWTGCNVTRTGINVWDEEWENGYYSRATGEKAGNSDTKYFRSKNYIPCAPNTSYYLKAPSVHASNNTYFAVLFYDADKSYISAINSGIGNTVRTTPQNAHFMTLYIEVGTSGATYQNDISVNYPSTDTDYHSGTANETISVSWQTEVGTVYGGTIDVATGLLTVDRAFALLNDASQWREVSGNPKYRYSTEFADRKKYNNSYDGLSACSYIQINASEYTNTGRWVSSSSNNFGIESSSLTLAQIQQDATDGKIAIVYELATPQTYQLTPQEVKTLLGTNNVWADTGDTSVTYTADTKMFIEKLTMPTEDDLVANQAITSGKYFMLGNSLYLALANIASGAAITIGTNAQRVSLADALNTINS